MLAWLCWWFGLFWLWMLLVGAWDAENALIGLCLAAIAAAVAERARRAAGVHLRVPAERLVAGAMAPLIVFADFGVLTYALARSLATGRPLHGAYLARPSAAGPRTTPSGAAHRAWTVLLAGYSPNAFVVDLDAETGMVLVHDLVPWRRSEEPA